MGQPLCSGNEIDVGDKKNDPVGQSQASMMRVSRKCGRCKPVAMIRFVTIKVGVQIVFEGIYGVLGGYRGDALWE